MKSYKPLPFFLLSTSLVLFSCGKNDLKTKTPQFSKSSSIAKTIGLESIRDSRGVFRGKEGSKEDAFLKGWQHWDSDRYRQVHIPSSNIKKAKKAFKWRKNERSYCGGH